MVLDEESKDSSEHDGETKGLSTFRRTEFNTIEIGTLKYPECIVNQYV